MCIDRDIELLPGPVPSHDTVALLAFEGLPRLFLAFKEKAAFGGSPQGRVNSQFLQNQNGTKNKNHISKALYSSLDVTALLIFQEKLQMRSSFLTFVGKKGQYL